MCSVAVLPMNQSGPRASAVPDREAPVFAEVHGRCWANSPMRQRGACGARDVPTQQRVTPTTLWWTRSRFFGLRARRDEWPGCQTGSTSIRGGPPRTARCDRGTCPRFNHECGVGPRAQSRVGEIAQTDGRSARNGGKRAADRTPWGARASAGDEKGPRGGPRGPDCELPTSAYGRFSVASVELAVTVKVGVAPREVIAS